MIYFIVSYPSLTWNWFWRCLEKGNTGVGCRERVYLSILSILRCQNWHHKNDIMLFRQVLDKKCVRHLVYDDWQDKDSGCQENLGLFRRRPFHGRSVMVTQVQIYKSLTCSSTTCLDRQFDFLPPGPCIKQYSFLTTLLQSLYWLKQGIDIVYNWSPFNSSPNTNIS